MSTANSANASTIVYGLCPGCMTLHRTTDCPDDHPETGDYCVCCEAISGAAAMARRRAIPPKDRP